MTNKQHHHGYRMVAHTAAMAVVLQMLPLMAWSSTDPAPTPFWLWTFLGRLHPLIVHFPISLLLLALLLLLIQQFRPEKTYTPALNIIVSLGAVSAVLAVVFGLLLAQTGDYVPEAVSWHQWTGIITAVCSIAVWWMFRFNKPRLQLPLLIVTGVAVGVTGHLGALLTLGEDYLSSALPSESTLPDESTVALTGGPDYATWQGSLTEEQLLEQNVQLRTVLAHHCYNCHGAGKVKGELRLDSWAAIQKGGKHGVILVAGQPDKSEIIRRIRLPRSHKEAMPSKGALLSAHDIALLENWIRLGAPWPKGTVKSLYRTATLSPRMPELPPATDALTQPIDRFVNDYFNVHQIAWAPPVDDRTYIRRVYFDVIGLPPPADSVLSFMKDVRPDKRQQLVSRLLQRDHDYAQHWLTFWNDALRNDYTGTGFITGGRADITSWLYESLAGNKPYDQFVQELITPAPRAAGFIRGIQWRGVVNASQRTEMQAAQNVAQVFMGLNLKCASCHDSFISDWKLDDAYAFANIFADSVLEINRCDKPTGRFAGYKMLYPQLGVIDASKNKPARLKQLADSLVQFRNGRLYRTLVNRVWAQVMGRGIVEPVDVMDNAPWSQDLLDWLAADFVKQGRDVRKLLYTILTSQTYQLPSQVFRDPALVTAPDYTFHGMVSRRLTAEQFADAVSSTIEPIYPDSLVVFSLLPPQVKTQLPVARAALVRNDPFLKALGRPGRETVTTSRESAANLLQALELTNGDLFNQAVRRAAVKWQSRQKDPAVLVQDLYTTTINRKPTTQEIAIARRVLGEQPTVEGTEDLIWALALHPEFQLIY